jgi:ferric-dicitrate binding protein FerR (iron transport regulator)
MTSRGKLQKEIRELSLKASDGHLSDAERERLNQLVETDDQACRLLLAYSMLDADLVFLARAEAAEDRAGGSARRQHASGRKHSRIIRFAAWGVGLAAAAALLVMAWPQGPLGDSLDADPGGRAPRLASESPLAAERQPQPIATLSLAPGAVFAGNEVAQGHAFLEGDRITLDEGEAHISMASGAEFVLKAPGSLEFISARQVRLSSGVLTAHVAQWGSGFTVDTDRMRVIDLGTRFAIAASADDDETHVLQGQVRVQPLAAGVDGRRSVLLSEGEALRVDGGAAGATRMDAEQDRFPAAAEDFRPFKLITMYNTGVGLSEGDEDPHWRITGGPDGAAYHGPQFGVVATADERYAPNEAERSQWISVAKDLRPGALPNAVFTYETTFDLTGFDLSTVMVAAQVLADNGVRAMRINGTPVSMEPWDDNVFGQSFTRNRFRLIEIQSGFVPGENRIEIDVWNGVYQTEAMKADPNPMSLRVEFQAFGRLVNRRGESVDRGAESAAVREDSPPGAVDRDGV